MHTNRISSARKILVWAGAALGLALLSGCATIELTNLTPSSLPGNPSQIYTFTVRATPKTNQVPASSVAPHIIIDGQSHDMTRSNLQPDIYDFEFQLPTGRDQVAYYFLVDYQLMDNGSPIPREAYTPLAHASIVSRYVLSLEVNRGPVGSRISVLGRGFTPQDQVAFDGTPVRTVYESPTSISFFVPALDVGKNYQVSLAGSAGNSPVGTFRVDTSNVTVDPTSLSLVGGSSQNLTFSVPNPAPAGGLLLDITTDVPESVIMPEVIVPEGQTSVSVAITGGKPGAGSLFLKGYGSGEVTIPVTVAAPAPVVPVTPPTTTKKKHSSS
jgi:hypothetical protein